MGGGKRGGMVATCLVDHVWNVVGTGVEVWITVWTVWTVCVGCGGGRGMEAVTYSMAHGWNIIEQLHTPSAPSQEITTPRPLFLTSPLPPSPIPYLHSPSEQLPQRSLRSQRRARARQPAGRPHRLRLLPLGCAPAATTTAGTEVWRRCDTAVRFQGAHPLVLPLRRCRTP